MREEFSRDPVTCHKGEFVVENSEMPEEFGKPWSCLILSSSDRVNLDYNVWIRYGEEEEG